MVFLFKEEDFRDHMIEVYNKRHRNYWHYREQTISCRVRNKRENRFKVFKENIVHYLYNKNLVELDRMWTVLSHEDYDVLQRALGFTSVRKNKRETFALAMLVRDISKSDLMGHLQLNEVVSTRVLGYYKEIFFLKCYLNYRHPQIVLRCLYHMDTGIYYSPINPETDNPYNEDDYREEIIEIIDQFIFERDHEKKSF